ncbi:MAG: hypothetical protein OXL68_16585 [Paracoccaceae bacterium]|nr:hypothetical protein [Paracoccaceae bacterium]
MPDIDALKRSRDEAQACFATLGDLRPGTLHENYRKCGKPSCHCDGHDSPGHGPSYALNRSIRGSTRSIRIPPGEYEQTRCLVEEHERFLDISARNLEASEAFADAVRAEGRGMVGMAARKGTLRAGGRGGSLAGHRAPDRWPCRRAGFRGPGA